MNKPRSLYPGRQEMGVPAKGRLPQEELQLQAADYALPPPAHREKASFSQCLSRTRHPQWAAIEGRKPLHMERRENGEDVNILRMMQRSTGFVKEQDHTEASKGREAETRKELCENTQGLIRSQTALALDLQARI
jgi:hypothetical protein